MPRRLAFALALFLFAPAPIVMHASAAVSAPVGAMPAAGYSNVLLNDANGLEVFMIGQDQHAYHAWCCWTGWHELPGDTFRPGIVAAKNLNGNMQAFAVGTDSHVYTSAQTSSGGWTPWTSLGGSWPGAPVVGRNADGRLQLFLRGQNGYIYTRWQVSAGGSWDTNPGRAALPGSATWHRDPVLGQDADGRIEVFAVNDNAALYDSYQTVPNGGFSSWVSLHGSWQGRPSVVRDLDGRLHVFARGVTPAIYSTAQQCAGCGFAAWSPLPLGGSWHHDPVAQINADGRLQLFVRNDDGNLYTGWQTSSGGWDGWRSIAGPVTGGPSTGVSSDGTIGVFYLAPDVTGHGALFLVTQTVPNGGFGAPRDLGWQWPGISPACTGTAAQCGINLGSPLFLLTSPNGFHRLMMQSDGNLVVSQAFADQWKAVWSSGTSGHPGAQAFLQSNGNLVIYAANRAGDPNAVLWSTQTSEYPGATLVMRDDGTVVIDAANSRVVWSGGTVSPYPYVYTATQICNHVFRIDSATMAWDPKAQYEVSRSYTFGGWNGHCFYKISDQLGIDVNTLDGIDLGNQYDLGWHWDVLAAAGDGAMLCDETMGEWPLPLVIFAPAAVAWCGAIAAAGYVIT